MSSDPLQVPDGKYTGSWNGNVFKFTLPNGVPVSSMTKRKIDGKDIRCEIEFKEGRFVHTSFRTDQEVREGVKLKEDNGVIRKMTPVEMEEVRLNLRLQ